MTCRLAVAAAVALGAALAAAQGRPPAATAGEPRSRAVYPDQRIALRFSHAQHLRIRGVRCVQCHAGAGRSESVQDRLIPAQARCEACHDIEAASAGKPTDPPSSCEACHPGFDATVHRAPEASSFPRANLVFSHARHLARLHGGDAPAATNADCESCHGPMAAVETATRDQLPRMATCLQCHDGRTATQACATCHLAAPAGKGGLVMTELGSGTLRPAAGNPLGLDHGPRFERAHALVALAQRRQCAACHAERYCLACHDGTTKPQAVHPNDFVSIHPVAARQDSPRCDACHRRQTFCIACHERVGVGANAPGLVDPRLSGRFHPPGWVTLKSPTHHAIQAARNIGQCASCHREDQCMQCHASASALLKPHPSDFKLHCRTMAQKNSRACEKCHADLAGAVARCQ